MTREDRSRRDALLERMERLGEHWWLFSTLTGLLWAGAAAVAALMVAVAIDLIVSLENTGRVIVLSLWMTATVAAALVLAVRPLRRRRNLAAIARRLEATFPQLGSDLINLVQLASTSAREASPVLVDGALRQSIRHAEAVPLERAAERLSFRERFRLCLQTPGDLGRAAAVLAVLLAAGGVLHGLLPGWSYAAYRLFHPARFVPAQGAVRILEVSPGDAEVPMGHRLLFEAVTDVAPAADEPAVLVTIADDGSVRREPLLASEDGRHFVHAFPSLSEGFSYRFEIGGTQTQNYRIEVVERPSVSALTATYRYPAYLGLAEETQSLDGGRIEAPEFTIVRLNIATTRPVEQAVVELADRELTAVVGTHKPAAWVEFRLQRDLADYAVRLRDAYGWVQERPRRYPIRVIPDEPPKLTLEQPAEDITAAPGETVRLVARATDDYAVSRIQLEVRRQDVSPEETQVVRVWDQFANPRRVRVRYDWQLPRTLTDGQTLQFRLRAWDNRQVALADRRIEPQEDATRWRTVRIVDAQVRHTRRLAELDRIREALWRLYRRQTVLRTDTAKIANPTNVDAAVLTSAAAITAGQRNIRQETDALATELGGEEASWQGLRETLRRLSAGRMHEAVRISETLAKTAKIDEWRTISGRLADCQDDILDVLRRLLDLARQEADRTLEELDERPGGDLPDDVAGQLEDLRRQLEKFAAEQRRVIEATEELAKTPVEDFSEQEEQKLKELAAIEDDWARFLAEAYSDLSRLPEQDFSNPSLLAELIEIQNELKMAEDALLKKAVEIAVPLEQLGAERAEEMTTNIEKWLPDSPDRERWSQEEPLDDMFREAPMAELPDELEDLIGELMEDEEDLFEETEDISSSWADSLDKGAGWDAMDGPISNMSARGVTGNRLPNSSEIGGRSGEGRSGKSSGEFVEETASGKGGRRTPSRLTPDPFEQGQIRDTSRDPVGGATGGGKESGQGGEGLEGPLPPPLKRELERLAGNQASLRNRAEAIRLQFTVANYNTDALETLIERMRRVEHHLRSGHYRSALRQRTLVLQSLGDLRRFTGEPTSATLDPTQSVPREIREKILGSMQDPAAPGWKELTRRYFERIAEGR